MRATLGMSATDLAQSIRGGKISSRDTVDTFIAQIERVNATLNAMVHTRFDQARAEADEADAAVRRGDELGELHGVPCSIKECLALTGMPQSSGLVARRDLRATTDATAVARVRKAGAIPLGVTNISELCMWMETSNRVYGRTNNPYDPSRIVGGSSGGEAAIVASAGVPFGIGSDVGGSIRMPAFFNGIFGHKPSGGLVPNTGQYPIRGSRILTTGPFSRHARDLMPLLRILAGPDGEDAWCAPMPLGDPSSVALEELTVIDVEDNGVLSVSDDLRAAQRRATDVLRARGARVEKVRIDLLKHSLDIWSAMLAATGGPTFANMLGNGTDADAGRELFRWSMRRSEHTLPAILLAFVEHLPRLLPARRARALEHGEALRRELADRIGPRGVMLYPSYPTTAPRHHRPLLLPIAWMYTAILNAMELPATQVPLGLDARGLPLGVQVVARHGNDHLTIAVAHALERAFGGWVPPKLAS